MNRGQDGVDARGARRLEAWLLLWVLFLLIGAGQGLYRAIGYAPTARFDLLSRLGSFVLLWNWFRQHVVLPYRPPLGMDVGQLILAVWPVSFAWFLWKHERWRGLARLAFLYGSCAFPSVVALLIELLLD